MLGASRVNKVNASTFHQFVARNAAVLKEAGFTEAQISNVRALANDLQRAQRTMQATALPASPNTAADVIGAMRSAPSPSPARTGAGERPPKRPKTKRP